MSNHSELRYFNPTQCCNCGPETDVPPSELRDIPIFPPEYGGTRQLHNRALVCPKCSYAILYGTDEMYESNEYPPDAEWRRLREEIHEEDDWLCCGCRRVVDTETPRDVQTHHIRPLGRAGSNRRSNVVTMCRDCHKPLSERQKSDALAQINVERGQAIVSRAGSELERITTWPSWERPRNPPIEALDYYEQNYKRINELIRHFEESSLPTKPMQPFLSFLDTHATQQYIKHASVVAEYQDAIEEYDKGFPDEVRQKVQEAKEFSPTYS